MVYFAFHFRFMGGSSERVRRLLHTSAKRLQSHAQSHPGKITMSKQPSNSHTWLLTSSFFVLVALSFLLNTNYVPVSASAGQQGLGSFTLAQLPEQTDNCATRAEEIDLQPYIAELSETGQSTPQAFTFMPIAGTTWQDLFINNFVDLDPGSGILDWDCSNYTYDGHNGLDVLLRSFKEQEIGVPVFAALDGTVTATRDGEPDMNTSLSGQPSNFVTINHGNGQFTQYLHLKRNSVAVTVGQSIKAGTQIGLAASSGNSNWPHLHLTPVFSGRLYEPTSGYCRAGASNWERQPAIRRDLHVKDFALSTVQYSGSSVFDNNPRTGTFVTGTPRQMFIRVDLGGLPANSSYRFRFFRPDGAQSLTFGNNLNNSIYFRRANYYFSANVNLTQTGTWRIVFEINDQPIVDVPFEVVADASQIANRPPLPINAIFDPPTPGANDVIFCRVLTSLFRRDPDYEIMRYRYHWRVNENIVRDVTSAALSDAIPRGSANNGDLVECEVTPSDGQLSGESVTIQTRIGSATVASVSAASFFRSVLAGDSIVAAFGSNLASSVQVATSVPLPTELAGTRVTVRDRAGVERLAPLFFVAPLQVNYLMPADTNAGTTTVTISNADGSSSETTQVISISPGLFTANTNGQGPPAAVVLRVRNDGSQSFEPVAIFDSAQNSFIPTPIDLGPATDQLFLILFGSGIRSRSAQTTVTARLAGIDLPVSYAGPQDNFVGLDQLNIGLSRGLSGKGEADLTLVVDGIAANLVRVNVR
jgi:uncharacterized protein (TIGR03437 family)